MLILPYMSPPAPYHPPDGASSFPPPCGKRPPQGDKHWRPCATQTFHTWGTGGKVGYPPPGSILYCTQSEPGGWYYLTPHPGTPLLGTGAATEISGNRPSKFGPPRGCWWGVPLPGSPDPLCASSDGASEANLP